MKVRAKGAGDILGVTSATVRRWSQEGRLPFELSAAGQRLYDTDVLHKFVSEANGVVDEAAPTQKRVAFYIRSSQGTRTHLDGQKALLTQEYGNPVKVYQDKASGLNDRRRGLRLMIDDAREDKFDLLAVTHKDRLARFGTCYIEEHLKDLGVEVVYTSDEIKSPEEELLNDFMSLITSFSGKFYRLRGYEHQRKLIDRAKSEVDSREKRHA